MVINSLCPVLQLYCFSSARPDMFRCTTNSLSNFHYSRIFTLKWEFSCKNTRLRNWDTWAIHILILFCLIAPIVTHTTSITESKRKKSYYLHIWWSLQRNVRYLKDTFQTPFDCTELLQGCNKLLHEMKC